VVPFEGDSGIFDKKYGKTAGSKGGGELKAGCSGQKEKGLFKGS